MPYPVLLRHPSLDSSADTPGLDSRRSSLFDSKDDFIARVGPIGMAAIYFGPFSLAPQDPALSRQALLKLSFAYRSYLQPAGIRFQVQRQSAAISGVVKSRLLVICAEILAHQIEGITQVRNETEMALEDAPGSNRSVETIHLLFATDQTLRSQVKVTGNEGKLRLTGSVGSEAQKSWAEQLAHAVEDEVISDLQMAGAPSELKPADVDDESLQALVLFRLRLVRETEHVPVKVKASRGVVTLHGKVRTESLRQKVEHLTRATLGVRELRSTLTLAP